MKRKTFMSALTKKEQKHLKECANVRTKEAFQRTINAQAEMRKTSPIEPCFECKHIAEKLGMEATK